jgi:hypothetical protein
MENNLNRFCESLKSLDPDEHKDDLVNLIYEITDLIEEESDISSCYQTIFKFIENCDGSDIGSPGPLVHLVEKNYPDYVLQLLKSIKAKPTSSSIFLLNRILNSELDAKDRKEYLSLLKFLSQNEAVSDISRKEAYEFYEHQLSKRTIQMHAVGRGKAAPLMRALGETRVRANI